MKYIIGIILVFITTITYSTTLTVNEDGTINVLHEGKTYNFDSGGNVIGVTPPVKETVTPKKQTNIPTFEEDQIFHEEQYSEPNATATEEKKECTLAGGFLIFLLFLIPMMIWVLS